MDAISGADIVDTVRDGLIVLDADLKVVSVNRAFCTMFETTADESVGHRLYDLGNGQWDIAALRTLLVDVLPRSTTVEDYEVEHVFPDIGRKVMLLNARKVHRHGNHVEFLLLAIDDVTEARDGQIEAERNLRLAEAIVGTIRDPLVILEDDLTVVTASREFLRLFGVADTEVSGRNLRQLGQGQWDVDALTRVLERVVPDDAPIDGFLLEDDFPGIGRRIFKINARKVYRPGNHVTRLLVVFEDATDATLVDRHRDVLERFPAE